METSQPSRCQPEHYMHVRNPLLSERDGNYDHCRNRQNRWKSQKPTTLWKRWKPYRPDGRVIWKYLCQKPTTLWKRWKPHIYSDLPVHTLLHVRNPLLSERDGNSSSLTQYSGMNSRVRNPLLSERDGNKYLPGKFLNSSSVSRKPTTLWKRWKPIHLSMTRILFSFLSETHYSLKEMETFAVLC